MSASRQRPRLMLAVVPVLLAAACARRDPMEQGGADPEPVRSGGRAVLEAGSGASPAGSGPRSPQAEVPAGEGAEAIVPPVPSGWTVGTEFSPPPPRVLEAPTAGGSNLLANPGFEDGTEPWWYFPDRAHWGGFVASAARAHGGRWSARLDLVVDEANPPPAKTHIRGVIQELQVPVFPTRISGWYFVDRWERGGVDQYLQFVVIVRGAAPPGSTQGNTQIRYLLAGIDHPPFDISNAKFYYVTREEPALGEWVYFERDLAADFQEMWGFVPGTFDSIRVLFEVRYDNLDVNVPARLRGRVYFDDLVLGT